MKVAIYCRVSTEDQSNDQQERICKEYCERLGYEVHSVYKDVFSGKSSTRPAYNELIKDLRLYKFRGIVVTKIDRLSRSVKHLLSLSDELKAKGVELVMVTQNIDTSTSAGRMLWQIMAIFAEFERDMISQRTKEGLRGKKNVGKRGPDKKPRKKRGTLRKPVLI